VGTREPGTLRRVFISSTSIDLREHRAAVKAAIERMDQHPVVMENFGAQGYGDASSVSRASLPIATSLRNPRCTSLPTHSSPTLSKTDVILGSYGHQLHCSTVRLSSYRVAERRSAALRSSLARDLL
jgi:Domain of unknown function (DUF4062)